MLAAVAVGAHPDIAAGAAKMVQVRIRSGLRRHVPLLSRPAPLTTAAWRRPHCLRQVERVIQPNMEAHAAYAPFFEAYKAMYGAVKPISAQAADGAEALAAAGGSC